MIYIWLNIVPILLATAAAFAFGAGYYTLLGKPWMAAASLDAKSIKPTPWPFIIAFVAEFWIASIQAGALIVAPAFDSPWTMAIGTAIILWLSFVMPTMLVNHQYEGRPLSLTLINGGHWLGVFLIQVIVLQAMGLVPPPGA